MSPDIQRRSPWAKVAGLHPGLTADPDYSAGRFEDLTRPTEYPATGQQGHRPNTGDVLAPALVCRRTFSQA